MLYGQILYFYVFIHHIICKYLRNYNENVFFLQEIVGQEALQNFMRTTSNILLEKEQVETKIITISTLNIVTPISPIITNIINHPLEITNLPYQEKIQNRTNQYQKYQSIVVTQINIKITHIIPEVLDWSRISSQLIYKLFFYYFEVMLMSYHLSISHLENENRQAIY